MRINPEETELVGKWIAQQGQVRGDATCEWIQRLTSNHLRKFAISKQWVVGRRFLKILMMDAIGNKLILRAICRAAVHQH